jgi:hypothetical protein
VDVRRALAVLALTASVALLCAGPAAAQDETKPIQLSLWDPVQIFDNTTAIEGFRLNLLYGVNTDVTGLDIGLVNRATGTVKGVQWGLVSMAADFTGWQTNWAANIVDGEMVGLQSGSLYNKTTTAKGVQLGLVNHNDSFEGFQLGLVNVTNTLHGLQIGLLNVVSSREKWKYLPIVSWSF